MMKKLFAQYGWNISQNQLDQFVLYLDLIMTQGKIHNLTGFKTEHDIIENLFIDSLESIKNLSIPPSAAILDLGSGAGIPSIPIKLVYPHLKMILLDSAEKKYTFIQSVIDQLCLKDITAVKDRAETAAHKNNMREQFDIVISRAVAPLRILLELSLPFLKVGGLLYAYKGKKSLEEIEESEKALSVIGGKLEDVLLYSTDKTKKSHCMIVIKKIASTPGKYPRKPGMPKKRPL